MGQKELQNLIESVLDRSRHFKHLALTTDNTIYKEHYKLKQVYYYNLFKKLACELDKLSKNN